MLRRTQDRVSNLEDFLAEYMATTVAIVLSSIVEIIRGGFLSGNDKDYGRSDIGSLSCVNRKLSIMRI